MTTTLKQIPLNFREMAKEELKKELTRINPSMPLDPDKIYINITHDATISSETLTETSLKRNINEPSLLSPHSAPSPQGMIEF